MDHDLAVIGAGVVGVSCALWARMRGLSVVLIDPQAPGAGTSYGNAGTIAVYACLPVNDPSVLRGLPGLVFGGDSPLALDWGHALRNPLWMLRFLANCRTGRSDEIAGHLAMLLTQADAGLNPLVAEAGAEDLLVSRGQLTVWSTRAEAAAADLSLNRRRALGVEVREVSPAEAREMEPGLVLPIERAVHFPGARHVLDPQALVLRMFDRFVDLGGVSVRARAERVEERDGGVTVFADGEIRAERAVIASGAFSRRIAGSGAERLPLGTERGYHLMFEGEAGRVTRPVGWVEGGFYATPMAAGLRLAGTVEIAALDKSANRGRLAYIARRGREMLGDLPEPASEWLGYRPTMPDSLPVIGLAPGKERVIHAFGHQHLGLTLGGITGRIVADLAEGRAPNADIAAYAPGRRFS
ncbi:NAD(P)/FAD-dependent oxidoreductase [Pseudooceanicola sp.]|uniref:NAD(P)/FAD-dependent oxidoreductase n=1 Tax=Pseudooceanicola sp. TaxID=1914328 RepID=UPI0035C75B79